MSTRPQATRALGFEVEPLAGATFGGVVRFPAASGAGAVLSRLEEEPEALADALYRREGLLLLPDMGEISEEPELLVRLSRLLGPQVENNLETFEAENRTLFNIHERVPEIILVTNLPPINSQPMARPDPPLTQDGRLPTRFPHRRGWHTDQSFRRPPPDFSLFYAVQPTPKGQGQTLFANAAAAYETLPETLKDQVKGLEGLHVLPGTGRSEKAVLARQSPKPLLPHQQPQRQPVVRVHPVTRRPALYLCEGGQMDWVCGPFAGLPSGPRRAGARLLYELMTHITQPRYTYTHEWEPGELVIYDNRCVLHAPTWYDADRYTRIMWRTTVRGNPGPEYAGERPSWIPRPAHP